MTEALRLAIRDAVGRAIEHWPNSHLGDRTRRQDLRSAFLMIRSHAKPSGSVWDGVYALARDVDRYVDM